jgi:glucose-1-phosphate thymidylyltransferase
MIWHSVRHLVRAGLEEILVVTSTVHMGDIVNSLGSGERFGCDFTYKVQEQPGGIAHALALGEAFAQGGRVVVLLGDNVFERSIAPYVEAFRAQEGGARVLLKAVGDPERFGVAALDEKHIVAIEEKPAHPRGNCAVVGCYMYDETVFQKIRGMPRSARGEWEITDVNNRFIEEGRMEFSFVEGRWTDAGTFESLQEANQLLLENGNRILP